MADYGPKKIWGHDGFISLGGIQVGGYESSTTDPRAAGLDRPIGSIVFNPSSLAVYRKVGNQAITDWAQQTIQNKRIAVAVTQTTIASGIAGESDFGYDIIGHINNSSVSTATYSLLPNAGTSNLVSGGNVGYSGGVGLQSSDTRMNLVTCTAGNTATFFARFWGRHNGLTRAVMSNSGYLDPAGTPLAVNYNLFGGWNDTTTALTSIDILSTIASAIGIGSEFMVRQWR